jgi:hypothetical protein
VKGFFDPSVQFGLQFDPQVAKDKDGRGARPRQQPMPSSSLTTAPGSPEPARRQATEPKWFRWTRSGRRPDGRPQADRPHRPRCREAGARRLGLRQRADPGGARPHRHRQHGAASYSKARA